MSTSANFVVAPELRLVPAGEFLMGDDRGRPDERPAHRVWTPDVLFARLPVTNVDYARFVTATGHLPSRFHDAPRFNAPDQPVVGVSWHDAVEYCAWLSDATDRRFRLPTEAAWERAARGGKEGEIFPWGDDPAGWAADPALAAVRQPHPYPVGRSRPNGFDLLDMGYNVHEWCADWYDPGYYAVSPARDPRGPAHGTRRSSRGGAWRHQIQVCRNTARSSLDPSFRYNDYGFRVVCDP
jgi:formylglycine-generating enzyme required for sulfatase activity